MLTESIKTKWAKYVDTDKLPSIADRERRNTLIQVLENTHRVTQEESQNIESLMETSSLVPSNAMGASSSTASTGSIDTFDPVLVSMIRRSVPNLMAYDIMGVQPMTGPVGLIFAMRAREGAQTNSTGGQGYADNEWSYNETNTAFSTVVTGNTSNLGQGHTGTTPVANANLTLYNYGGSMSTAQAEALGTDSNTAFPKMSFSIEKVSVTAGSRALAADYTHELAQDLKAIHGMDAGSILSDMLAKHIVADINREAVRTINISAVAGAQLDTTTAGTFDLDTDSNGRWSVEKFKGLLFQIERDANQIAKGTRMGRGNIIICSADVASALKLAGVMDYAPAMAANNGLQIDDTGNTFAGVIQGTIKVYIDPYATGNYITVGLKGSDFGAQGLFYCPYVPLQKMIATDQGSFTPKIGYKTRYGMVANPFAGGLNVNSGAISARSNVFYRHFAVTNLA